MSDISIYVNLKLCWIIRVLSFQQRNVFISGDEFAGAVVMYEEKNANALKK